MTKFETYSLIDVGAGTFQLKTRVLRQIWDMSADKIRAREPTDLNLTLSGKKLKGFQKMSTSTHL